jgi:ubiquinone biosynthesis monooxygenase Coq7
MRAASSTFSDRLIAVFDEALRTLAARPAPSRPSPAAGLEEPRLDDAERRRSAALMRVNHAGEIAAQALYVGQALTARSEDVRARLLDSAREERDHLAWCAERLDQIGGRESRLGPFWFAGSAVIGAAAGVLGDGRSLGFVVETERQVEAHIDDHLRRLPPRDAKSAAILTLMRQDEARHGTLAERAGGRPVPAVVRRAMSVGGGFLRRVAYFL